VVGASGAIAGTIAAYLILHPRAKMWVLAFGRIPLRLSAMYVLGFWIVFQVVAVVTGGESDVAWWSHLGGLVCGAVLVLVLRRPGTPLFDGEPLRRRRLPALEAVDDSGAAPLGSPPTRDNQGPWA
jgi:membrane associated rhomboid family serine protease